MLAEMRSLTALRSIVLLLSIVYVGAVSCGIGRSEILAGLIDKELYGSIVLLLRSV